MAISSLAGQCGDHQGARGASGGWGGLGLLTNQVPVERRGCWGGTVKGELHLMWCDGSVAGKAVELLHRVICCNKHFFACQGKQGPGGAAW